jgi:uncharacterized repeat protein (TIGR03847 family)
MIEVELTEPHHVTVGWTGRPGARTFFVQADDDEEHVTLVLEKDQVGGIADLLTQLLARLEDEPATDWDRAAMALREPIEPRWRVGGLSVGLDPELARFVIELEQLVGPDEDDPPEVRIWIDRDQARRLAAHALEQVGQGRPTCQLCGRPTDLDGTHVCPATNGHGRLAR